VLFIVSLYALVVAILLFFFRAIRNINTLSGFRLRSPYVVLFMLVPIANLIVIPYLEYFAYQRSRALARLEGASKPRSLARGLGLCAARRKRCAGASRR
jgi:hypothetical protein